MFYFLKGCNLQPVFVGIPGGTESNEGSEGTESLPRWHKREITCENHGNLRYHPPRNSRPYQGTINHWFPLIRPAIRALFLGGGWPWWGHLTFPWENPPRVVVENIQPGGRTKPDLVVEPPIWKVCESQNGIFSPSTWRIIPCRIRG